MITIGNQIELRHLKYFMAVAEELHFKKAADRLYISQPGLSRQIKQLEDQIGVSLFIRNNRNVSLTEAGKYLKNEVSLILKKLNQVIEHAQSIEAGDEGSFSFGYIGSAMQNVIPQLLVKVRQDYPSIHFDFKEMDNQQQIDGLIAHDLDIGFVRLDRVPSELHLHPVFSDTFSIVLPKDHPVSKENFNNLNQLSEENFILFDTSYSKTYYDKVMHLFDEQDFTPHISHKTVHATTIYQLVENRFGISIVPSALKFGYDFRVKFIELEHSELRTTLSAVWHRDNRNPILKKIRKLL